MSSDSLSRSLALDEFRSASPEEWRAAAEKLLKGAPFEKRMVTRTYEGIDLQPIYTAQAGAGSAVETGGPGEMPFRRGTNVSGSVITPWLISQEFPYSNPSEAGAAIRSDLERGQTAVYLPLDRATRLGHDADKAEVAHVGLGGVSVSSLADLSGILNGIDVALVPIHCDADLGVTAVLAMLVSYAEKSGIPSDHLRGTVASDPLGLLLSNGKIPCSIKVALDHMHVAASWAAQRAPGIRTIGVRSGVYHDAGAHAVQELGSAIATGVEYLRAMVQRGMAIDDAARQVWFSLSSGPQFFMEVAKFRAARMLWATAVNAFGGSEESRKMVLHVRTSAFAMTAVDPYVNMLRTTTQALAGAVAGCDSMHVGFFDEAVRPPDEFARRIARNTQSILQSEAHMREVIDPAGGSWYIEALTDEVADRSWKLFQAIEAAGGIAVSIQQGSLQEQVGATSAQRADGVARRKDPIVGVTVYANTLEVPLAAGDAGRAAAATERANEIRLYRTVRDSSSSAAAVGRIAAHANEGTAALMSALIAAAGTGATVGELLNAIPVDGEEAPVEVTPLIPTRLSAGVESLRHAMHKAAQSNGHPVRVFLATMGPVAQHKARADFAAGFFAVAGCEVITPSGFATPEDAARAAVESGAEITVMCSTDETYPALVPPFCKAVRGSSNDLTIVLAGYPQDHVEALRAAGIEEFIHIRSNVLETLRSLLAKKGVRP
jgi:methylmalonyl-CoA mutase